MTQLRASFTMGYQSLIFLNHNYHLKKMCIMFVMALLLNNELNNNSHTNNQMSK